MRLESTRHQAPAVSFREALVQGLAPDGGLYLPTDYPRITRDDLAAWRDLPFDVLASHLAQRFLTDEFGADDVERLVRSALDFPVPLAPVAPARPVLELFHGPTLAFKDFGARFLARFLGHVLAERDERATILVATSGDTGSAVAHGFFGERRVHVVVLYPAGRVSPFQESHMATLGGNVTAVRVAGSFDDCQRLVKLAFLDPALADLRLSSANSINIGRLLPQSFYYVAAYLQAATHIGDEVVFAVPTGNIGNLTAAVLAGHLGIPMSRLVAATNANRTLPDYLETGTYRPRPSVATLSNAMDVGDPSNFMRLLELHAGSVERLRGSVYSASITEAETRATIRRVYERWHYVLDPHTAVAWAAADSYCADANAAGRGRRLGSAAVADEDGVRAESGNGDMDSMPVVTLATAHPAKFDAVIREELGFTPPLPRGFEDWQSRPLNAIDLSSPDYAAFARLLRSRAR